MTKDEVVGRLVSGSKEIEAALEALGAEGKGLHTKALSIEGHLGTALVKKIQFIATIRNKAVHEDAFKDVPFDAWTRAKDQVLTALGAMEPAAPESVAEAGARRGPARFGPRRSDYRTGRTLGGIFVAIAFAVVALAIVATRRANEKATLRTTSKAQAEHAVPPWSVSHPAHAEQVFPWREEQAAFVAAGENGALPAETMWEVTSSPRPAHRKGAPVLELDIRLGGGKLRGKVFVKTWSPFGRLETSSHGFEAELSGRKTPAVLTGELIRKDGRSLGAFTPPYECRREVPKGCGDWKDNGVGMVALSTVSFANALKIVDVR